MELEDILKLPLKERLTKLRELYEKEEDPEILVHIASCEKDLEQEELADISHHLIDEEKKEEEGGDSPREEESIEDIPALKHSLHPVVLFLHRLTQYLQHPGYQLTVLPFVLQ